VAHDEIRSRKWHPTLGTDRMKGAVATYQSRLDAPEPDECDGLAVKGAMQDPVQATSA
jgi:hypothetical protein